MKKWVGLIILCMFIISGINVNASYYAPVKGYYYEHNPLTYRASSKSRTHYTYINSSMKKDQRFYPYFKSAFKVYEKRDKDNRKYRKFNLNVKTTKKSGSAQAIVYLNKKNTAVYGVAIPCIKVKKKSKCSVRYVTRDKVDFYKIIIYKKTHTKYHREHLVGKEARNTIAHEFGHGLGMGHFMKNNAKEPYSASYKSVMGYNSRSYGLTTYDYKRLVNLYGR